MNGSLTRYRCLLISAAASIAALGLASCSTAPLASRMNANQLLKAICAQGGDASVVTGSVWAQVQAPEMKGQFPATFRATQDGTLALEITDLIGTPQAWLRIERGKEPELRLSDANRRKMGGRETPRIWAGLPLEFAPTLFLGKVPCPLPSSSDQKLAAGPVKEDGFEVRLTHAQTQTVRIFRYWFQDFGGEPWVERVEYSMQASSDPGSPLIAQATLEFMDPTDPGAYAKKWNAKSAKGEIKVRWKDRKTDL